MDKAQIIETTKEFLSDEFEVDIDSIQPDANLKETLDLDSLDYVDLVVVIEENLGFKPTADDFKSVETFDDFYEMAMTKIN